MNLWNCSTRLTNTSIGRTRSASPTFRRFLSKIQGLAELVLPVYEMASRLTTMTTIRPLRLAFQLPLSVLLSALLQSDACGATAPLSLNQDNPHYLSFRGHPTILITSGEHYGAVINLDFDYAKYLRTLESDHLNLTRMWAGAYVEPTGAFNIASNSLAPHTGKFICPWARSDQPGYSGG